MRGTQRVLVTGGTSTAGASIVERLREQSASVVFTGRNSERGEAVAKRTSGMFVRADARDLRQVQDSVRAALDLLGGLDALVLAAGVLHVGPLSLTTDAEWDELIETNLLAACVYATECLPALRESGGGAIVTVSSAAAVWPDTAVGAYAVTKRALLALSEMLAMEGARHRVRVNVVCPGDLVEGMTALVDGKPESDGPARPPLPPLGRLGRASDVAEAVAFFLSESASFCTGTTLLVDGGMGAADRAWAVFGA